MESKVFHKCQEHMLDVDVLPEPWWLANEIDDILGQALAALEHECSSIP
jgi:hypothetical protein